MTTRVHPTTKTGSKGELKAAVIFADIGWAPPVKLSEDIGTDFLTFARDSAAPEDKDDAWDLGAPVFLQVKASEVEYLKPANKRRGETGWWFTEPDTYHFDHWLSFGLPYLLVLVDVKNQIAYWAEVNGEAIVSTGKGRKIFVPVTQTVDADNIEALTKIAVSRRKYALEGAVWNGSLNDLGPANRLRNALVLPRLVAPHPNKDIENLTFEEAAAMVMRNRYSELSFRGDRGQCPKTEEWESHKDWGWRFVHALHELLTQGESSRLGTLAADARHRFERDACLVLQACAAYTAGATSEALDILKPTSATKPADRGWLQVQRASFLLELNKPAEAAVAAKKALVALKALDGDLSVSVVRGSAASILYSVAGNGRGDLEATITAQDNAGAWWRAQDVSWALEKDLRLRFEGWTDNRTIHFINSTAAADLSLVAWNAAFSGAWGSWRHLSTMCSHITFTVSQNPLELGEALSVLILVGAKKAAKDASAKLWRAGPIAPLEAIVRLLADQAWSNRDEGATMAVLASAGDLLHSKHADHVVDRIIDLITVDGPIRVHGGAWSDRWNEIDGTLRTILTAATIKSHRKIADLVADNFASCTDGTAQSLVYIASALETEGLGSARWNKLTKVANDRGGYYGAKLLEVLAPNNPDAIAALRARAEAGDTSAFRSLLVAGSTDHDDFIAFGQSAAATVRKMVEDARGKKGNYKIANYTDDNLDDLTVAALNTGDTQLWEELMDALEACVIEEAQQQHALRRLAHNFPDLPPSVQHRLRKLAPTIAGTRLGITLGTRRNEFPAAVLHLRIAAGLVPDHEVEALLLTQLRRDPAGFVTTLSAWNAEHKLPFLSTMVVDEDPNVRARAGFHLIEHAHRYPADRRRVLAVLQTALIQDSGCSLRDGIAQAISAYPHQDLAELQADLRNHPSARIRERLVTVR